MINGKMIHLNGRGLFDNDLYDTSHNREIVRNISGFWEANSESESDSGSDYDDDDADGGDDGPREITRGRKKKEKISFRKLKQKIHKQYDMNIVHKYGTVLDVFVRYIQCHHMLYSEASYLCNSRLNIFMLPCIFLSTTCAVLSGIDLRKMDINITVLLAILNGIITFLLTIINYLKLDAHAEAHKISAYQFMKLKGHVEFSSGELLLYDNDPFLNDADHVTKEIARWAKHHHGSDDKEDKYTELMTMKKKKEAVFITKMENIILEIKDSLKNIEDNNHFALPQFIINKYKTIYKMNVFLYIKSIDTYKNVLLNDLRNVKNEIRFYTNNFKDSSSTIQDGLKEKYIKLYEKKNDLVRDFVELHKGYTLIDTMLQQEMTNIELLSSYWVLFYVQHLVSCLRYVCCAEESTRYFLPDNYKESNHIGCMDGNGVYLLEKVLNC
mgnify:CR=1 FL=1